MNDVNDAISRQAAISAICNACGKIDCDKMDKCEKLQLPPANNSEIPNSSDTISRQAAIDALDKRFDSIPMEQTSEILMLRKDLRELPPASNSEIPNNSDTISRQSAIDVIKKHYRAYDNDLIELIAFYIEQLPPIQPKRGHWIEADVCGDTTSWECSCCHNWTGLPTGWNVKAKLWFCPKCTADMREVTE